jgi:hypothetical protein
MELFGADDHPNHLDLDRCRGAGDGPYYITVVDPVLPWALFVASLVRGPPELAARRTPGFA